METGGDAVEFLVADFDDGLGLWNGQFSQANGDFRVAVRRSDARGDPLQRSCTAGVEPDPLLRLAVHSDGEAHSARTKLERENLARCSHLIRFENAELSFLEIELNSAIAKEVRAEQTVNGLLTGKAELAQVNGDIVRGQWNVASADTDAC